MINYVVYLLQIAGFSAAGILDLSAVSFVARIEAAVKESILYAVIVNKFWNIALNLKRIVLYLEESENFLKNISFNQYILYLENSVILA